MSVAERAPAADASGRGAAFHSPEGGAALTVVEPLIFERSRPDRRGVRFPQPSEAARAAAAHQPELPDSALRATSPRLPEVTELDLLRHFNRLSHLNHAIDLGFYPLGSCTMKYNPKVNEWAARLPGFADSHPLDPESLSQGSLELMWLLGELLREVSGFASVSLQPAAGAQGELTGMLMTRAHHKSRGEGEQRTKVLVPDSAHGTNPATATMVGYTTVTIRSNARGGIDLDALRAALGPDIAALMITNPSTLGIFEDQIEPGHRRGPRGRCDRLHGRREPERHPRPIPARRGGLRRDALQPAQDLLARRTAGGGPGAGPVGVSERLAPFLPRPVVRAARGRRRRGAAQRLGRSLDPGVRFGLELRIAPTSIGKVRSLLRELRDVRARVHVHPQPTADAGLREISDDAVLAANYLRVRLADAYDLPYDRICKHEVVFCGRRQKRQHGVTTLDIAKAILDQGIHPPTIYFPLIVEEALMIEPTETESLETLDRFVEIMHGIASRRESDPDGAASSADDPGRAPRRGRRGTPARPATRLRASDRI